MKLNGSKGCRRWSEADYHYELGQIVLPVELRELEQLHGGEEFDVVRLDRGDHRIVQRTAPTNGGALDWLLACPEKGYFVPVESESTDGT